MCGVNYEMHCIKRLLHVIGGERMSEELMNELKEAKFTALQRNALIKLMEFIFEQEEGVHKRIFGAIDNLARFTEEHTHDKNGDAVVKVKRLKKERIDLKDFIKDWQKFIDEKYCVK